MSATRPAPVWHPVSRGVQGSRGVQPPPQVTRLYPWAISWLVSCGLQRLLWAWSDYGMLFLLVATQRLALLSIAGVPMTVGLGRAAHRRQPQVDRILLPCRLTQTAPWLWL